MVLEEINVNFGYKHQPRKMYYPHWICNSCVHYNYPYCQAGDLTNVIVICGTPLNALECNCFEHKGDYYIGVDPEDRKKRWKRKALKVKKTIDDENKP